MMTMIMQPIVVIIAVLVCQPVSIIITLAIRRARALSKRLQRRQALPPWPDGRMPSLAHYISGCRRHGHGICICQMMRAHAANELSCTPGHTFAASCNDYHFSSQRTCDPACLSQNTATGGAEGPPRGALSVVVTPMAGGAAHRGLPQLSSLKLMWVLTIVSRFSQQCKPSSSMIMIEDARRV